VLSPPSSLREALPGAEVCSEAQEARSDPEVALLTKPAKQLRRWRRIVRHFLCLMITGAPAMQGWAQGQYSPDSATVALYHLDDVANDHVADASAHGLHTATSAIPVPSGRFGGAFAFDGDDAIAMPLTELTTTPDATYEAWVYPSARADMVVVERAISILNQRAGRGLRIQDGQAVAYAFFAGGTQMVGGTTVVALEQWTHLAAVFDETNRQMKLFVNGVLEGDAPLQPGSMATNLQLVIGRHTLDAAGFFRGKIDEVRISNVARGIHPVNVESAPWGAVKAFWR